MSDNTVLNLASSSGGDTIRTIAKTANSPAKTEVVLLDIGGGNDGSSESVVSSSNPLPITGNLVVTPTSTLNDNAIVACASGSATAVVSTNTSRRSVTLTMDPSATGYVYARKHGGSNNLLPMSPGTAYVFPGTYGIDVYNNTGSSVNIYILEQQ